MQTFFSTEFCFFKMYKTLANFDLRSVGSHNQKEALLHILMQMLTTEAAQAEIINKDFTSPETVLPLPSFGRNLQHLPQQTFWRQRCYYHWTQTVLWLAVPDVYSVSGSVSLLLYRTTFCILDRHDQSANRLKNNNTDSQMVIAFLSGGGISKIYPEHRIELNGTRINISKHSVG